MKPALLVLAAGMGNRYGFPGDGGRPLQALGDRPCRAGRGGRAARALRRGFTLRNTLSDHGSVSRGVCAVDEGGFLRSVTERTSITRDGAAARYLEAGVSRPLSGDEPVSMNMWGFTPALFAPLRRGFEDFLSRRASEPGAEYFLPSVVSGLIERGETRVKVLRAASACFGVTYKEDRETARAAVRRLTKRGEYPERLWA